MITDDDTSQIIIDSECITQISIMNEAETLSELLNSYFNVLNLADCNVKDLNEAVSRMSSNEFELIYIERYWCILASLAPRFGSLVTEKIWLYKSAVGFDLTYARNTVVQHRMALIPEINDSEQEISRMISNKLSLLWLPKLGNISERIYESLNQVNNTQKLPFLREVCTPKKSDNEIEDKTEWPFLTRALQNVLSALIITDNNFLEGIEEIKVFKTKQAISSDLYARTAPGTPEVFWKKSTNREAILIDVDTNEGSIELIISVSGLKLEDYMITEILRKRLVKIQPKSQDFLRRIMRISESNWGEIDSSLDIDQRTWKVHERPLVATGIHSEFAEKLSQWYGGCQVCGRQTPSDRSGGFQEGVVSLFKESGGRYYSDSIQYTTGNVMYLCPVHKSLYSRSKNSKLMWIPVVEDARKQIEATPTKEKVKEIVNKILSTTGDIEIEVMTFEKIKGDGQEKPTEKIHQVKWVKEHASSFRDAVTQYLTGLIN